MIDPAGIITTIAGTGQVRVLGRRGPVGEAKVGDVTGIALAPDGDLCLTETTNARIRLVAISGLAA